MNPSFDPRFDYGGLRRSSLASSAGASISTSGDDAFAFSPVDEHYYGLYGTLSPSSDSSDDEVENYMSKAEPSVAGDEREAGPRILVRFNGQEMVSASSHQLNASASGTDLQDSANGSAASHVSDQRSVLDYSAHPITLQPSDTLALNHRKGIRWEKEEDDLLMEAVEDLGKGDWIVVAERISGRDVNSCRSRYKYVQQVIKSTGSRPPAASAKVEYAAGRPWNLEDEAQLLQRCSFTASNEWTRLASVFLRPVKELKQRYQILKFEHHRPEPTVTYNEHPVMPPELRGSRSCPDSLPWISEERAILISMVDISKASTKATEAVQKALGSGRSLCCIQAEVKRLKAAHAELLRNNKRQAAEEKRRAAEAEKDERLRQQVSATLLHHPSSASRYTPSFFQSPYSYGGFSHVQAAPAASTTHHPTFPPHISFATPAQMTYNGVLYVAQPTLPTFQRNPPTFNPPSRKRSMSWDGEQSVKRERYSGNEGFEAVGSPHGRFETTSMRSTAGPSGAIDFHQAE